jgi:hypothetical protein
LEVFNIVLNCTTPYFTITIRPLNRKHKPELFFISPPTFLLTIILRQNYQFNESSKRINKKSCLKRLDLISSRQCLGVIDDKEEEEKADGKRFDSIGVSYPPIQRIFNALL